MKSHSRLTLYLTASALVGMIIGFGLGIWTNRSAQETMVRIVPWAELLGKGWLCALIILAIPLVSAYLYGVMSNMVSGRMGGRIGLHALLFHLAIMVLGIAFTYSISYILTDQLLAGVTLTTLRGHAGQESHYNASVSLIELADTIQTSVARLILPALMVTAMVALVLARFFPNQNLKGLHYGKLVSSQSRRAMNGVMLLMPLATLSLSFSLASKSGYTLAGVMGRYVLALILLLIGFTVVLYVMAAALGRVPVYRFAKTLLPAQLVAATTRSSLASMPTLLTCAERAGIPTVVAGLVIPFSASVFRLNRAVSSIFSFVFFTALYNLPTDFFSTMLFMLIVMALSFGSPGVPSGGKLATIPVFLALGVPLEMIVLTKAIDAIPDIFKTVLNVTEGMTIAVLVTRSNAIELLPASPVIDGGE